MGNNASEQLLQKFMMKVLTYLHDMDLLRDLMELMRSEAWMQTVTISVLPRDSEWIKALQIDVLLLDCTQDPGAAFAFAKMLRNDELSLCIMYMVNQSKMTSLQVMKAIDPNGVFLCAPFSVDKIMRELMKSRIQSRGYLSPRYDESTASQLIQDMGIPVHLNGFRYIKSAVKFLLHRNDQKLLMHQLYKEVARIHMTTSSRVEKAIRDAIDYAYRYDPQHIQIQNRKPTNSQLIHLIYERMLQKQREANEERKVAV